MRTLIALSASVLSLSLAAGCTGSGGSANATPTPAKVVSHSREVRKELNERLDAESKVFHAGCRDEEKAACQDTTRVCGDVKRTEATLLAAAKKGPIAIEWEMPRLTWEKNEGVDSQYWFVKPDGSGSHYWRIPPPDDNELQVDCGNGLYCGWHKADHPAGTLYAANKLTLTPADAKEPIADLSFCPEAPPQPSYD